MCVITAQQIVSLADESLALDGFAHIEFASTEEALRAVCQGAPHGLRYGQRLLDIDLRVGYSMSRTVIVWCISPGDPLLASNGRPALMRWSYDVPNVTGATVCTSPFPCLKIPTVRLRLRLTSCDMIK
jgi:hypothetical protein